MDVLILLVFGTVFAAVILGILIGRVSVRSDAESKIAQAFKRGQEEAEVEKANIALELGQQLIKMRESIELAAEAYENTVQVVRDRLSNSAELLNATEAEKKLLNPGDVQLSLQFDKGEREPHASDALQVEAISEQAPNEQGLRSNGQTVDEEQNEFGKRSTAQLDATMDRGDLPIQ